MKRLALTDRNGLYGIPHFLRAAREHNISALVGSELVHGSMRAVALAMNDQKICIQRIQEGVTEMKLAADKVARGMEEQVRATKELDRGLNEREDQIQAANEVSRFLQETAQQLYGHFDK